MLIFRKVVTFWLSYFSEARMKKSRLLLTGISLLVVSACVFYSFRLTAGGSKRYEQSGNRLSFPYRSQGLTERQAAAHLLSRFTYGANAKDVDEVVKLGLENWFEAQLNGNVPEDSLNILLEPLDAMRMSNTEVLAAFPKPLQVLRMASAEGIIPIDSVKLMSDKEYKRRLGEYVKAKNIRQQSDFTRQFINQRIIRAVYAKNQLHEVLTGFWFNHFNVSLTKRDAVLLTPAYERDAIRPFVTGKFKDMLKATAKSPAMLVYLDNFISSGSPENVTAPKSKQTGRSVFDKKPGESDSALNARIAKLKRLRKNEGLNENYAREVMELHTLGVDGGYTQSDVTQAARILTGWTIYPIGEGYSPFIQRIIDAGGEQKLIEDGFIREGDFIFAANRHDNKEKKVLGKIFPAFGGYAEGLALLDMLAHHQSTAKFISKKLAAYFVNDNPPQSLVDKMSKVFLEKEGDIREMLITMVNAPEFWSRENIRSKTKSPFELVISAVRALDASVDQPYQLFARIDKIGQRIYYFQAPTGFPDKAEYWINTGALLNRMNFGLDIASQQLRGVKTDLLKLNDNHEPESAEAALVTYLNILLPERDVTATVKRLLPLINQPGLNLKLELAEKKSTQAATKKNIAKKTADEMELPEKDALTDTKPVEKKKNQTISVASMLAQVVGIILGSPEFQRR